MSGPYETEREAAGAARHIYDSPPGTGATGYDEGYAKGYDDGYGADHAAGYSAGYSAGAASCK